MAQLANSKNWVFDVSALMVLISEDEELKYRLSGRSKIEALCAAPVAGLQTYLKSYEILLQTTSYSYFSPYGCKTASLRNMTLDNAIKKAGLLEDGKCTYFQIPQSSSKSKSISSQWIWVTFTWLCMGELLVLCQLGPGTTWIGLTNCVVITGWSAFLRIIERIMVRPASGNESLVTRPDRPDSVVILGRSHSAVIISGSRKDIKAWTANGLIYNQNSSRTLNSVWQAFTRVGTLFVLILAFSTNPNGSTMDQVIFILLNVLGQLNTLMGLWLNAKSCLNLLGKMPDSVENVPSRTCIYASLIRHFKDIKDNGWVDKVNLLPQTDVWSEWRDRVASDTKTDPKELYNSINDEYTRRPRKQMPIDSTKPSLTESSSSDA
ncbi:hypothetical protein BP6252_08973 [Coleophoma cylindrospora]|uniref:Uncharacterized protein n=1 Tax=Coleophoma cylindrospora TaxID=1849047 RepID=A0A3D8R0L2_9HELO|nr:hypothetical protein BP6252_08973 [Coleophoma cylindrospora]